MSTLKASQLLSLLEDTEWWSELKDLSYELKPNGHLEFPWPRKELCLFCKTDHNHVRDVLRLRFWERKISFNERGFFCGNHLVRLPSAPSKCLL
jgi:hypothetical protein